MRVHISLPVTDLAKSQAFYSSLFGVPASKVKTGYLNFRLNEPAIHLALMQQETAMPHPQQHFGIELPDSEVFAAWEQRGMKAEGARAIEPEPNANCCYARANKLWLTDPDGHRWELWHRTGEFDGIDEDRKQSASAGS